LKSFHPLSFSIIIIVPYCIYSNQIMPWSIKIIKFEERSIKALLNVYIKESLFLLDLKDKMSLNLRDNVYIIDNYITTTLLKQINSVWASLFSIKIPRILFYFIFIFIFLQMNKLFDILHTYFQLSKIWLKGENRIKLFQNIKLFSIFHSLFFHKHAGTVIPVFQNVNYILQFIVVLQ
jgi:hypothetical protein